MKTEYEMEELLPLVAVLSRKYTGAGSTSLSYEKAEQLMEAVLYCLREYQKEVDSEGSVSVPVTCRESIPVEEQYRAGAALVVKKAEAVRRIYNELTETFEDYGVRVLRDTVKKGIPEFLKWYDPGFCPQDTILTLDYPVLTDCMQDSGVDAVYRYLRGIWTEQKFLGMFDREYVVSVLEKSNPDYQNMIDNICSIVLLNTLGHVLLQRPLRIWGFTEGDYDTLIRFWKDKGAESIEEIVRQLIRQLALQSPDASCEIEKYLCEDAKSIAVRVVHVVQYNCLEQIFVV